MTALAGFGCVALYLVSGWGLAAGLGVARGRPMVRAGYAYLLGIAAVPFCLYALSHGFDLGVTRRLVLLTAAACALGGAVRSVAKRRPASNEVMAARTSHPRALASCAILAVSAGTLGLFADAVTDPVTDWDGKMTWLSHARHVRAARSVDAPAIVEPRWYVIHPRYPLLLPVAQAAALEALGTVDDERIPRALYAAFFPAFLLVTYDAVSRRAGPRAASAAVLVAALVPQLGFVREGGASGMYSDLALACFSGAALSLLCGAGVTAGEAGAGGLLLAAAILTKNEGLPLVALVLGAALLFHARRKRSGRLRRAFAALLPPIAATGLLISWRSGVAERLEAYTGHLLAHLSLSAMAARLALVPAAIVREMAEPGVWAGFWLLFAGVLVLGWRALLRPGARAFILAPAAFLLTFALFYGVSEIPTPRLVQTTWSRFLLQVLLPLLVVFGLALRAAWHPRREPA